MLIINNFENIIHFKTEHLFVIHAKRDPGVNAYQLLVKCKNADYTVLIRGFKDGTVYLEIYHKFGSALLYKHRIVYPDYVFKTIETTLNFIEEKIMKVGHH